MRKIAINFKLTMFSCFVGIFNQAIISNLTAILFVPMMVLYGFSYIHLGILVAINFATQVASDLILSRLVDRFPFRSFVLPACLGSFAGLLLFACSPWLFDNVFVGIVLSTILFSASAGLLEVLMSPVVDAIPNDHKGTAMSLLHSFFAWGQVATIVITTLFLFLFGWRNWQYIVFLWALVPFVNFFMFLRAPFPDNAPASHRKTLRELLKKPFFILILFAIFFGAATELIMGQFASSFMEKAMLLPKLAGDLIGVAGYAAMMGVGRILFSRKAHTLSIHTALIGTSALGILCYLIVALSPFIWLTVLSCILCGLASSMLWPGVIIIAGDHYPMAGSWIFALLAASGDIGAAFGPWVTSVVIENSLTRSFMGFFTDFYHITTEQAAIRIGILFAVLFPAMALVIHLLLKREKTKEQSVGLLKEGGL